MMPASCLEVAHSLNVKPHSACPQYVSHVEARVTVVRPALSESCVIVTQREPALVVLVHMKHPVLDAGNRRRSPAAMGDACASSTAGLAARSGPPVSATAAAGIRVAGSPWSGGAQREEEA